MHPPVFMPMRSEPDWRPRVHLLRPPASPWVRRWLTYPGSLTQGLTDACPGDFRVRLVGQTWERPALGEVLALGMRRGEAALVRQVYLLCDRVPWVFARTIVPRRSLSGSRRSLLHLGERPLGAMLFADPSLTRGPLEVARVELGCALHRQAGRALDHEPRPFWARRLTYALGGHPLLVTEVFLPALTER
jgi:chorismate--pyruvate lyase